MAKPFPKLDSKVILAPMHDTTNLAFRIMCKKYGAGLVSTELVSANAIADENKTVMKLAKTDKLEKPAVAQLFGQNTEKLVCAAKILEKKFSIIDINFGCPSKRIIGQGAGAALLKKKNRIAEIVNEINLAIKKPLTVKIRAGFDAKNINGVEIAKICEENGASAIIIHGRTVGQGYAGKADWTIIKQVKEAVNIPVIGNGDVMDGASAEKMLSETGCDYIMVGRAAIGNPFIFKQIDQYLKTGVILKNQTKAEKINDYFEYIKLAKKFDCFSFKDARQKAQEFTKGLEGSSKLRKKLNGAQDWESLSKLIKEF
jgi:tRNA-dihydrouridine synthase B